MPRIFIKKDALAQVFSCEFYEISKNASCYRTSLVAASDNSVLAIITVAHNCHGKNKKKHCQ